MRVTFDPSFSFKHYFILGNVLIIHFLKDLTPLNEIANIEESIHTMVVISVSISTYMPEKIFVISQKKIFFNFSLLKWPKLKIISKFSKANILETLFRPFPVNLHFIGDGYEP